MRHTEGHRPEGRPRADSPAPWSPGPNDLTGTGTGGEEGDSCAGWSGSDLAEGDFFMRMMHWEDSEEDRAGTRAEPRTG
jgi:hypothetical protein